MASTRRSRSKKEGTFLGKVDVHLQAVVDAHEVSKDEMSQLTKDIAHVKAGIEVLTGQLSHFLGYGFFGNEYMPDTFNDLNNTVSYLDPTADSFAPSISKGVLLQHRKLVQDASVPEEIIHLNVQSTWQLLPHLYDESAASNQRCNHPLADPSSDSWTTCDDITSKGVWTPSSELQTDRGLQITCELVPVAFTEETERTKNNGTRVAPIFKLLPSVGTWLCLVNVPMLCPRKVLREPLTLQESLPVARTLGTGHARTTMVDEDAGDTSGSESGDIPLDSFEDRDGDFDIITTWRVLPAEFQIVPSDIGELAFKEIHRDVVRIVCRRMGVLPGNSRVIVFAAFAAQVTNETWARRSLGKLPRTSETVTTMTELLADDVQRTIEKLSGSATDSLAARLRGK
jgi:hypothetical protein